MGSNPVGNVSVTPKALILDFADNMKADASMDVAYVGVIDNIADVIKFATAQGDKTVEVSETADAITTYYTSTGTTEPGAVDLCGYFASPKELHVSLCNGFAGNKLSEDGTYVHLAGNGSKDGWIWPVKGNTAVGKYVVIKYRLNNSEFTSRGAFCGNATDGPTGTVNYIESMPVNPDGEWHIAVYNMTAFANPSQLVANDAVITYYSATGTTTP